MNRFAFVAVIGLLNLPVLAAASDVQVIANSSLPLSSISASDLKRIFLGSTTTVAGGTHVEPVLAAGGAHEVFLKQYVGKTDAMLRTRFKALVFTGRGSMPKSFDSEAEVVGYVAKTRGAIGYVSASTPTTSVKKLTVAPE